MKKFLSTILILACLMGLLIGCKDSGRTTSGSGSGDSGSDTDVAEYMNKGYYDTLMSDHLEKYFQVDFSKNVKVRIVLSGGDSMVLELYPDIAPITVRNFVYLVCYSFYENLTFHRIIQDFMIQGGDPNGDGTGGSEYKIKGEFTENGVENTLKHEKGVISMARAKDNNSASSQFFICTATNETVSNLDGKYAAFGKVVEGMDILDKLAATPVGMNYTTGEVSKPTENVVIERMEIID